MPDLLRITREGEFKTVGECPNQCRDKGWSDYRYTVTIEAEKALTPEGWIIDNRIIRDYFLNSKEPDSCEGLAQRALEFFKAKCAELHLSPCKITVRIYTPESYFDAEHIADHVLH